MALSTKEFILPEGYDENKSKYINRKHLGGIVNAKGNSYEEKYLLLQILSRIGGSEANTLETIYYSQVKNRTVDDLVIQEHNNHLIYHQLKDSINLKWSDGGKSYTILDDFKEQESISAKLGEDFELKIVASNSECDILKSNIPDDLSHTTKEHFPAISFYELIQNVEGYRTGLENLLPGSSLDQKIDVCKCLLGHISYEEQKPVSTSDIWNAMSNIKSTFELIRIDSKESPYNPYQQIKDYGTNITSTECVIQNNHMDVKVHLANGATIEYSCSVSDDFLQDILTNNCPQIRTITHPQL